MNPKLIIASLTGVGLLGGGVTGCYYYCGQKTSEKQKNTSSTEEKPVDTTKSQETITQTENRQGVASSALEDRAQDQEATRASVGTKDVGRTSETSSGSPLLGAG